MIVHCVRVTSFIYVHSVLLIMILLVGELAVMCTSKIWTLLCIAFITTHIPLLEQLARVGG